MTVGNRVNGVIFNAPGYGAREERCLGLTYGKQVISNETEGRRFKSFYPRVATSGEWSVTTVFLSAQERDRFNDWIAGYYNRVSDPYQRTALLPMRVIVPRQGFVKDGYPIVELNYGDSFGSVLYPVRVPFKSATTATVIGSYASSFKPAISDVAALHFYPAGVLDDREIRSPYRGVSETEGLNRPADGAG